MIITALAFVLLRSEIALRPSQSDADLTMPVISAAMNKPFVNQCYAVENDLQTGDFEAAENEVRLLPRNTIHIKWDDSKVPAKDRGAYRKELELQIKEWKPLGELTVVEADPPDIVFSFTDSLPVPNGGTLPEGATFQFDQHSSPRLSVVIALFRMAPLQPVTTFDVHNEVAFAITQYLGLERTPGFFGFSSRTDQSTIGPVRGRQFDFARVKDALDVADRFRKLIQAKKKLVMTKPVLTLSAGEVKGVNGYQDEPLGFTITATNKGNSELRLFVLPDCGCLSPSAPLAIGPGKSGDISVNVNTSLYSGHQDHRLYVYSNDPAWTVDEVPVQIHIEPLYRFVQPGPRVLSLTPGGVDTDVYMVLSSKARFTPLLASIVGLKGKVDFQEWQGTLPSDTEDPEAQKKGYKFHIHIDSPNVSGRVSATLEIGTDSSDYRQMPYTFDLQKGIVALPSQVYVGTIPAKKKRFQFFVSRPFSGFKVTKIETSSPYLSAAVTPTDGDREYRIDIEYNGMASYGPIDATIKVYTDDPTQPVLKVPFTGSIQ